MNIVIYQDVLRRGGTERTSVWLANTLAENGHAVTLLTNRPLGVLASEVRAPVRLKALQPIEMCINTFAPGLAKALVAAKPQAVVLMGTVANIAAPKVRAALGAREAGSKMQPSCKIIGTVRTGKVLSKPYVAGLKACTEIITNAQWWAQALVKQAGLPGGNIHTVHNAYTRSEWNASPAAVQANYTQLRAELGITEGTRVFVNVARVRQGKRQRWLMERLAKLPGPAQLWLVGSGPDMPGCKKLSKRLGTGNKRGSLHVRFLGDVANPYAYLCAADCFISASKEDSFPNALVEAQWLGKPVLATQYRGVAEAVCPSNIAGGASACLPADDPKGFATAMAAVPACAHNAQVANWAHAAFSPEKMYAAYEAILKG